MSRIGYLGIRGIRSYSNYETDSNEIQSKVVNFNNGPVTLILGENGSGKTVSFIPYFFQFCRGISSEY